LQLRSTTESKYPLFFNQYKQLHDAEGRKKSVSPDTFCVRFCSL